MASVAVHIAQANRNQDALESLLSESEPFWDWIAIVAFYKCVHIAEAIFCEHESAPHDHSTSHKERGAVLKRRYPEVWRRYWHLLKASKVARYLEYEERGVLDKYSTFAGYMPSTAVKSLLLGHYLVQLEVQATLLLADPDSLKRYVCR